MRRLRPPERWYRDVWLLAITVILYLVVTGQQAQNDDTAALAERTARLTRTIQAQRANSIVTNCRETNRRHDNTIRKLDDLLADIPPGPERDRAKANRAGTVLLIDALVPKMNCRERVTEALTPAPQLVPDG